MAPNEFIAQEYQSRKKRNPNFSLRAYAKWLGMSPAQISQIMAGKRPVTLATLKKVMDRVGTGPFERRALMESVMKGHHIIDESPAKVQLQEDQFQMISDWYHMAILSLTKIAGAHSDPRWVAQKLGIQVEQASQALRRLEKLGILSLKPFKQISEPFEITSEVPSAAIRKYHKQNLDLAAEKLETIPVDKRQFQSIALTIRMSDIPKFKKAIDRFLEDASSLDMKDKGTEVYHLNVQFFPVTKLKEP